MHKAAPQRPRYAPAFQRPAEPIAPPAFVPEAVDIDTAAKLMSVSVSTAKRLVDSGELPSLLIGRLRRIRVATIRDYLTAQELATVPTPETAPT